MTPKTPQTIPELYEAMMMGFNALGRRMDRLEGRMGRLEKAVSNLEVYLLAPGASTRTRNEIRFWCRESLCPSGEGKGVIVRKRPDYGDATPEDLVRALMNGHRRKGRSGDQFLVHQSQRSNNVSHLVQSIEISQVVLPRKFPNVAIQVLWADLVENSLMSPLQHGPEALDSIRMGLTSHVLTNAVLDGFMVGKRMVGQSVIGVDLGTGFDVLHDEPAHGLALGVTDNLR